MNLMETSGVSSKAEYLEKCRQFSKKYFDENGMFIAYLRKRQPNISCDVSPSQRQEILRLLELAPNMKEKSYERLMSRLTDNAPSIEAFRTVRSVLKANTSPLCGVIVAFKQGDDIKIGWSLCNLSKKSHDKFDQYDGIRRAIERAEPMALVRQKCDARMVPHTCFHGLKRVMDRATNHFNLPSPKKD